MTAREFSEIDEVCEPFTILKAFPDTEALDVFLFIVPDPATRAARLRAVLAEMEACAAHIRELLNDFTLADVNKVLAGSKPRP
jgi:hypothetical protein